MPGVDEELLVVVYRLEINLITRGQSPGRQEVLFERERFVLVVLLSQ